jgi:Tol biopolymer transport system component
MPSVAELLDRESQTVDLDPGGFERLTRQRDRRQRNRRIRAGTLAIVLMVVATALLLRAFRSESIPADRPAPTGMGLLAYPYDGDVYVADGDGSSPVRIADGHPASHCGGRGVDEYWAEGPIWSPDGNYLAYRHTNCDAPRDDWWDVVISDPEGNVVASFPSEGWRISWSPDSTRVAVWVDWEKTIGIYSLHGVRRTLLHMPPGWSAKGDYDPEWLPDGTSLLVPADMVIPIDGSTPHKLRLADRRPGGVTYSPDGSRIAYATRTSFVVAAADGSHPREVFGDWVFEPMWSPNGDLIAFASRSGHELHVLDVATETVTLVAEAGPNSYLEVIDLSPHGDQILFSRTEGGDRGARSLWSVHADGSDLRRLVTSNGWGDWQSTPM